MRPPQLGTVTRAGSAFEVIIMFIIDVLRLKGGVCSLDPRCDGKEVLTASTATDTSRHTAVAMESFSSGAVIVTQYAEIQTHVNR